MARRKKRKPLKIYVVPLEEMQKLWRAGHKVVPSKKRYNRKKYKGED